MLLKSRHAVGVARGLPLRRREPAGASARSAGRIAHTKRSAGNRCSSFIASVPRASSGTAFSTRVRKRREGRRVACVRSRMGHSAGRTRALVFGLNQSRRVQHGRASSRREALAALARSVGGPADERKRLDCSMKGGHCAWRDPEASGDFSKAQQVAFAADFYESTVLSATGGRQASGSRSLSRRTYALRASIGVPL